MKLVNLIALICTITFLQAFSPVSIAFKKLQEPDKTIKIGLLIQDNKSLEAKKAAEMAVWKINSEGGINGQPVKLLVRTMEGPWGTGSKQAVDMIFNEKVWAILGSHDGRNAHLVEQVTTKARAVFLSAWASDPTLSQAFVPWFFNCVPNDRQQAETFIEEVYIKRKMTKIAVVSDNGYDSKLASETFVKTTKKLLKPVPAQLYYDNSTKDFTGLIDDIIKAKVEGVVLLGQSSASISIIQQMQLKKMKQPIFGSLSILGENEVSAQDLKKYENVVLISTGNNDDKKFLNFQSEYKKECGKMPGAVAVYAYDGINLIIEAIKNSGFERDKVQSALLKIHYGGITGLIQFDEKGNRLGKPGLIEIKNGNPVTLKK